MHLLCVCVRVNVRTVGITGQGHWVLFVEDPVWRNGTVPDTTHPIRLLHRRGEREGGNGGGWREKGKHAQDFPSSAASAHIFLDEARRCLANLASKGIT